MLRAVFMRSYCMFLSAIPEQIKKLHILLITVSDEL